jgi:formate transporter
MDCVPPLEVVSNMVGAGSTKGALPAKDLLIRGFLSGALLGFATSLAITATRAVRRTVSGRSCVPGWFRHDRASRTRAGHR